MVIAEPPSLPAVKAAESCPLPVVIAVIVGAAGTAAAAWSGGSPRKMSSTIIAMLNARLCDDLDRAWIITFIARYVVTPRSSRKAGERRLAWGAWPRQSEELPD